ncbi:uncharacterized protein EV154DRAFT_481879 [Mucor mucedo]|uniref:uncharacterized protein n=1 Tax=Mucor mucedo TaxID=29922 RepID=UPI00221E4A71|nr:uncharacterized protein EV154DRAFT_481879 [Mucor mucedo]KAI7890751.1 hypothetical protein EV154DRAFT_481879 [Mucor mucedo]
MSINDINVFPCNAELVDELFPGVEYGKGLNTSIGLAPSRMELPSEEVQDLLEYSSLPAWSPGDLSETSSMRDESIFDFFNPSLSPVPESNSLAINNIDDTAKNIPEESEEPAATSTSIGNKRRAISSLGTPENKKQKTATGFECPVCQHVLSKKYNLDTHLKTHDTNRGKDHHCTDCNMSFNRSAHLKRHKQTVHEQLKEHSCNQCQSKYTRVDNLRKHIAKKHMNN